MSRIPEVLARVVRQGEQSAEYKRQINEAIGILDRENRTYSLLTVAKELVDEEEKVVSIHEKISYPDTAIRYLQWSETSFHSGWGRDARIVEIRATPESFLGVFVSGREIAALTSEEDTYANIEYSKHLARGGKRIEGMGILEQVRFAASVARLERTYDYSKTIHRIKKRSA